MNEWIVLNSKTYIIYNQRQNRYSLTFNGSTIVLTIFKPVSSEVNTKSLKYLVITLEVF